MDNDTATALAIIILSIVGLVFWAASEALLTRQRRDPLGIAKAVGVLRTPSTVDSAAFADAVEDELAARRNGGVR